MPTANEWLELINEHSEEIYKSMKFVFKECMKETLESYSLEYVVTINKDGEVRTGLHTGIGSMDQAVFNGDALEIYRTQEFGIFDDYDGYQENDEVREILEEANALDGYIIYFTKESGFRNEQDIKDDIKYFLLYHRLKEFAEDTSNQEVLDAYEDACENMRDYFIQCEEGKWDYVLENLREDLERKSLEG